MLSKKQRVTRSAFKNLKNVTPQRFFDRMLSLSIYKTSSSRNFSFIVSKKVAKTAIRRNFLRRRGYLTIQKFLPKIKDGYSCLFFFKSDDKINTTAKIESEVNDLLKKAHIIT